MQQPAPPQALTQEGTSFTYCLGFFDSQNPFCFYSWFRVQSCPPCCPHPSAWDLEEGHSLPPYAPHPAPLCTPLAWSRGGACLSVGRQQASPPPLSQLLRGSSGGKGVSLLPKGGFFCPVCATFYGCSSGTFFPSLLSSVTRFSWLLWFLDQLPPFLQRPQGSWMCPDPRRAKKKKGKQPRAFSLLLMSSMTPPSLPNKMSGR